MEWKQVSKLDSKKHYEDTFDLSNSYMSYLDSDYSDLRQKLNDCFLETKKELGILNSNSIDDKYRFDVYFGVKVYELFTTGKYKMGVRQASNDGIWRYIQLFVVPNIIVARWDINAIARLFNQSNRLYLKSLWWFIHLSYAGIETKHILDSSNFSTDTIVQFTERTGKSGYQIELYRTIMRKSYELKVNQLEFRKLMKLNSARLKVINPYLFDGGIDSYVIDLIRTVRK